MSIIDDLSYGWIVSNRASAAWIVASCLSGVCAP